GTVAQLAQSVARAEKNEIPAIVPVDRSLLERIPLSFAQERLWFLHQLDPHSAGYNIPGAVTMRGALDLDQLERALNVIIARHESLRTLFPTHEGRPYQRILATMELRLQRFDLTGLASGERAAEAARICRADATRPFDLANGPLVRGLVIRLGEDEHIVMLNMHHIISDGWSLGVLTRELGAIVAAFREGRDAGLAPLPVQYADYSVWQRTWLEESGVLEQQLAYWQQKLAGVPESLDLPTDHPRPAVQSFAGATHAFALDAQSTARLKHLAEEQGGTLYMVLLAAFNVLLHRYTGQTDLCIGSPIANRQYGETEGLIGMFVNTLALRNQIDADDSFDAFLARVRATALEAYAHQDAPFEKVVERLHLQRNMAVSPLFQVMVTLQNVEAGALDGRMQRYSLQSGISKFDLTAAFSETPDGLSASIEYSTALFEPQTIARMAEHFTALARVIAVTPDAKIRDLDFIGGHEKRLLLQGFNQTDAEHRNDRAAHQLFVERATTDPEKVAIVFGERELTYGELYEASQRLAVYLQSRGVGPERIVAICMQRSPEMIVAIAGTLIAGGAYLPLDSEYPDERIAYVLQDSDAALLLTESALEERLGSLKPPSVGLIALDRQWTAITQFAAAATAAGIELRHDVRPHHLAYVIYTSGSTGQPKGVMVEHRNLANLVEWHRTAFDLRESDRSTSIAGVGFDAAVWEMWPPLCAGATLVLPPAGVQGDAEALLRWWGGLAVDVSFLSTPLAEFAFSRGIGNPNLRVLLTGGDRLRQLPSHGESFRLINNYGPTECTVVATSGELRPADAVLHIGRPVANTRIYILDAHRQPVPVGVTGEIYIGGAGVARGYLNRAELTAERFVDDPFSGEAGARMYRTGDLGRWLADGTIDYRGRIDTQVKIRGLRIELGEIEARLQQHPAIQDCAVIAQGDGDKRLLAFYRAKESTELPHDELRAFLAQTLPEYMLPAAFVSLAAIPLNANGKVDRRALSQVNVTMPAGGNYVAPRNAAERQLTAIWSEVLGRGEESIGVEDDFFELGGHSLSAVQLMAKTNRQFGQALPLAVLFSAPTIAALAAVLTEGGTGAFDIVVPIQTGGDAAPVFAMPGAGGNVLSLRPLSRALGVGQPFFALQAVGLDGSTAPLTSVEQTAQANLGALKAVQPAGPYRLIGHSYGGVVAYEMARILLEQGDEVASLVLLDSFAPSVVQHKLGGDEFAELREACVAVAGLYDKTLDIDVDRLRTSTKEENVQYLAGLLNEQGLEIGAEQFAAFHSVYRANLLCYRGYEPSMLPAAIDVLLYRATEAQHGDWELPPDYGWNQLLPRPVRTHDIAANHHSILEQPHVERVAALINQGHNDGH
ncbi:MAG TPA: amino acid adenylation domain-containing protein, partial [Thermoanaerobaculia bacterium]